MVERVVYTRPKTPGILKERFVADIHPYTMMFLYRSYKQRAYENLSDIQRLIFDRYFTGSLTIAGQKEENGKKLESEITDGFQRLRESVSDEVRDAFREGILPLFKETDYSFIRDEKNERKKRRYANSSLKQKGKIRPQEVKDKISDAQKRNWNLDEYRQAQITAMNGSHPVPNELRDLFAESARELWKNKDYRERLIEAAKKKWKDPEYREKTLKALEIARQIATEKRKER